MTGGALDRLADDGRVDEPIVWFARVRSGTMSESERADFEYWLTKDENAVLYEEVEAFWQDLGMLRTNPRLHEIQEGLARPWFRRALYGALAASLLIVLAGGLLTYGWTIAPRSAENHEYRFATRMGQQLPVALEDGSSMVLDAASQVRVSMASGQRLVEVERGRALFRVRHEAANRPFVVAIDGRTVTAVGTEFSVDRSSDGLEVVLVQGKVDVRSSRSGKSAPLGMRAGTSLFVSNDGRRILKLVDTSEALAWSQGRLVFTDARFAEVIDRIGRYSDRVIHIAPDGTGDKRFGAVLKAGDVDTFLEAVQTAELAQVRYNRDGSVTLHQ